MGNTRTKIAASVTTSAGISGFLLAAGTCDPNTSVLMTDDRALSPILKDVLAVYLFVSIVYKEDGSSSAP
jgi:hypothetical protein